METRRGFVRGVVAGGAAALFVGAQDDEAAGGPLDGASSEVEVLARVVDIEQLVVFSYRHVLGSVRLSPSVGSILRRFLGQEVIHEQAVAGELRRRGRRVPAPPSSVQVVDGGWAALGMHKRLEQTRTEPEALLLLQTIEGVEQHAFHDAIVKLSSGMVGQLAAEILTCEAQQWT